MTKEYKVLITETLQKTVIVEAETEADTEEIDTEETAAEETEAPVAETATEDAPAEASAE